MDIFLEKLKRIIIDKGAEAKKAFRTGGFPDQFYKEAVEAIAQNYDFDGGAHYHVDIDKNKKPAVKSASIINVDGDYRDKYFETRGDGHIDVLYHAILEIRSDQVYSRARINASKEQLKKIGIDSLENSKHFQPFYDFFGFADAATYGFKNEKDQSWHFFSFFFYRKGHKNKRARQFREVMVDDDLINIANAVDAIKPISGQFKKEVYSGRAFNPVTKMARLDEYQSLIEQINTILYQGQSDAQEVVYPEDGYKIMEKMVMDVRKELEEFVPDAKRKWEQLCPALMSWTSSKKKADRELVLKNVTDPINGRNRLENAHEFFQRVLSEAGIKTPPYLHELRALHPVLAESLENLAQSKKIKTDELIPVYRGK